AVLVDQLIERDGAAHDGLADAKRRAEAGRGEVASEPEHVVRGLAASDERIERRTPVRAGYLQLATGDRSDALQPRGELPEIPHDPDRGTVVQAPFRRRFGHHELFQRVP